MSIGGNTTEVPTNCSSPFDARIYISVAAVAAASGFLSLLACCFIIFIIFLFKKWKYFSQRLVLYLAISAAVQAIATILGRVDYQNQNSPPYMRFCIFSGFLSQVAPWMVLNAIICIVISLLLAAFSSKPPHKFEWGFVAFIFAFPLALNWIPFIQEAYGKAGAWCWIRSQTTDNCDTFTFGQVLQLVLWYIPLYVIMVVLIVLYVVVLIKLYRLRKQWTGIYNPRAEVAKEVKDKMGRQMLSLIAYPLIFFLLYLPQFIIRIHALIYPNDPQPALWFISAIIFPFQGGAIAVAFSLDPDTRRRLRPLHVRAALSEFCSTKKVEDYPAKDDKESSFVTHSVGKTFDIELT